MLKTLGRDEIIERKSFGVRRQNLGLSLVQTLRGSERTSIQQETEKKQCERREGKRRIQGKTGLQEEPVVIKLIEYDLYFIIFKRYKCHVLCLLNT